MKRKGANRASGQSVDPKSEPAPETATLQERAGVYHPRKSTLVGSIVSAQTRNRVSGEGLPALAPAALVQEVREGLPLSELEELQSELALPMERLAPKIGLSKATWHRRKSTGRLTPDESDKVLRFARLLGKAIGVFGHENDARQWLHSPQLALGGASPLDYAETEIGAREVENLLGRIDYGVYS